MPRSPNGAVSVSPALTIDIASVIVHVERVLHARCVRGAVTD